MKNMKPSLVPVSTVDSGIVILQCPDLMHFDRTPLNRLFAERDAMEAEEVVCRVLEDIAMRLDMMQTQLAECDFGKMEKPAKRVGHVADQLGMTEVSVAANHVVTCLGQMDGVALEATMARLERAFDAGVSEVWNFREL